MTLLLLSSNDVTGTVGDDVMMVSDGAVAENDSIDDRIETDFFGDRIIHRNDIKNEMNDIYVNSLRGGFVAIPRALQHRRVGDLRLHLPFATP